MVLAVPIFKHIRVCSVLIGYLLQKMVGNRDWVSLHLQVHAISACLALLLYMHSFGILMIPV